ncbi:MAG: asparagine synthase (glutamine-hydrolyzing) [Thermodesulfobacteriota bacterium]|nr:asparagine synthase (glutamine-hydrolyzing) [Thermodesulfobacteriota bacterium]
MCGICGIYSISGRKVDERLLNRMSNDLIHRGPDGEGIFVDAHVGLGHRRLSIIDLETGEQPMGNEDGSIQVVFNGEIYNFSELKKELKKKGHIFKTRSDTETIVHGYEEWGNDFVQRLRGMFAIALWDARKKKLVMVRDRVGKKPLYYFLDEDRLLFASELKALLEDQSISRDIDPAALDSYLSFGYVPSPLSIFKAVKKLPPAHVAVYGPDGFSLRQYWHLDMESEILPDSEEELFEEMGALFDEAVNLRLISDVPLGAFLSGGIDSSAVVACMAGLMKTEPVKTASIGFSDKKFDELEYARIVASQYNTDHTEYVVEPKALEVLDDIVWHLDEPFADASAIPTYYVSKMARKKVTVALSGDGGDETFAGYIQRYYMNRVEDNIRRKIPRFARENILGPIARIYPKADILPRPLRLRCFLNNLSSSFEKAYFRDMSFYFLPEMKEKLYLPGFSSAVEGFRAFSVLEEHFKKNRNPDVTTRVQYIDIKTYLSEDILVKVDRMSMAHSLEVRSPILDHKLMEFAGKLPSSFKLKGSESKYILKKINENRLPGSILYRKKQGFSIPLAAWLRDELKELARDTLLSPGARINDYFAPGYIRDLWKGHLKGRQDYAYPLWALMMFELWQHKFLAAK